jgi:urocanate hydratase
MGVIRHADAGYDIGLDTARRIGVRMPMEEGTHAPDWQR